MNTTHFHMLLNHFPIIGTLIGSGILVWGIVRRQDQIKTIPSFILLMMALIAIPVYLTGEPAEETVEGISGISKTMIDMHEDAATISIWLMELTGLLALIALVLHWYKKTTTNVVFVITLIASLICFAAMARTGYYGGQIRHTELAAGAANAIEKNTIQETQKREKDDD